MVAMIALVLVLYVGVDRPPGRAAPADLAADRLVPRRSLGCLLMIVGGAMRAGGTERPRKPPGVL